MEPHLTWFCPPDDPKPKDIWCKKPNSTLGTISIFQAAESMYGKDWPTILPPFAPIAAFTAVVDGSHKGLPDDPYHLLPQGKIIKSPAGDNITVIMGTNKDEMALFLAGIPVSIKGLLCR
jgi:hypothetical protein